MTQKILITGANGGFGTLAINTLLAKGHTVVASMRDIDGRNKAIAEELREAGAHVVDIDVTDDHSVNNGVNKAIELAGGLDVLINNAGVGVGGIQELFTIDDMKKIFEINVFGVQRMTRAVLPHFHQQQSGLLLNISSLLGRITIPFYGPYNASKWALEALSENYRTELSSFGIDVAIIEPGGFPTSFVDRLVKPSDNTRDKFYGDFIHAPAQAQEGFEQALANTPEQDPQLVADAIANVINTPAGSRAFRTVVDKLGMGEPIVEYNNHLSQITHAIYENFGTADMLNLKKP